MPDDGGHPNPREVLAGDETPSGTTAFLHALMSMLGEVLDRVDGRLSSLESKLAARSEREPDGTTTPTVMARLADLSGSVDDIGRRLVGLEGPERLHASLAALGEGIAGLRAQVTAQGTASADERSQEMTNVVSVLERLSERLEGLEARGPAAMDTDSATTRLADLSASVEDIGRRLAGLVDIVTASREGGQGPNGLQASLEALGEGITDLRAQVTAQRTLEAEERSQGTTDVLAVLDRLSERLEGLEARGPAAMDTNTATTRLADLSAFVEDIGRRLAGLADIVAASTEADQEGRSQEITSVVAALERLGQRIDQLESRDPAELGLERAMSRLDDLTTAVDSIGYGMAGMADLLSSSPSPEGQQEWPEGLRAALLALGEGVVELRQDLHVHPVGELRITVRRLEGQLTLLTNQLATQPGPGAAMAMVAAGLAERFEERTDALTELLGAHAAYVRQTWERIEGALDGGSFDELAVGEAIEHMIDNQELLAESMERVTLKLEDLQGVPQPAGDGLAREALETLGAGMESVGVRVDDVRRRLAALARTLEASSHEKGPDTHGPDPTEAAGRQTPTAGRRLASDLGLRGRGRPPRRPIR